MAFSSSAVPPSYSCDPAWQKEVGGENFQTDLQLNLSDFERNVAKGMDVDLGFIDIFARDIALLQAHYQVKPGAINSHRVAELPAMNERFKRAAETLRQRPHGRGACDLPHSEPDQASLVGPIVRPVELTYRDPSPLARQINTGLAFLSERGYGVRRVRGNGHCLFSSLAAGLLTEERLRALRETVLVFAQQGLKLPEGQDPMAMIDWCIDELHKGASVESLLQREGVYYDWIFLLRQISTGYWRRRIESPGDKDRAVEELFPTASTAIPSLRELPHEGACLEYLRRMSACSPDRTGEFGGIAEITALERVFNIRIRIFDANLPVDQAVAGADLGNVQNTILLLYQNNHYDILYPPRP